MDSTIYFEVFVGARILFGYVFRDDIVGHIAGTTAKVASRPQVSSPKLLLPVRKLRQQVMRCPTFQPLQQSTDRHLRRQRDQQVYMVLRNVAFEDRYLMLTADIPDQIPNPCSHFPLQRRPSIFRDPHQMQMDFEYSVRASPVFRHPRSLPGAHALKAVA
jgi:hypothetical protein